MEFYNILSKKSTILFILGLFLPNLVFAKLPNDPNFNQQSFQQQINSSQAWDYSIGSSAIVVAVIDIGVDIHHPDLKQNIWLNKAEIANNGIDDDDNGYVDDVNGWNFVDDNNYVGLNNISSLADIDLISHGTIVSGIIGAVGGNSLYSTGINWQVSIMPLRAIDNDGQGSFVNVAKAVNYAIDNGADVINLSVVSATISENLKESLKRAWKKGVVIIAAAGNDGYFLKGDLDKNPVYPVCFDTNSRDNYIVGVGSIDSNNELSSFSSYGSCIDILAPGRNINSTLYYSPPDGLNQYFGGHTNGTSFSVPQVSGAAALLKSLIPSWDAHEINNFIVNNSKDIFVSNLGWENNDSKGLDIGNIMKEAINTVAYLSDSIKNFYYQQGNHIYVYNTLTKSITPFDHVSNETLVDFALYDINDDGVQEIILLLKRNQFYYLQIADQRGRLIKEYYLPRESNVSGDYLHFNVINNNNNIYYILEANYNGKKFLDKFDNNIKKINSVDYIGQKWDATSSYVYFGNLSGTDLKITQKSWQGNIINQFNFNNVNKWFDFSVRDILNWSEDELIFLVQADGKIQSWIVNETAQAIREKVIKKTITNNNNWRLLFNSLNNLLWPVNLDGGKFPLLKNGYEWVGEKEIAKIEGVSKLVLIK